MGRGPLDEDAVKGARHMAAAAGWDEDADGTRLRDEDADGGTRPRAEDAGDGTRTRDEDAGGRGDLDSSWCGTRLQASDF